MSKKRVVFNHSINSGKMNVGDTAEIPTHEAAALIKEGSATLISQSKSYAVGIDLKALSKKRG